MRAFAVHIWDIPWAQSVVITKLLMCTCAHLFLSLMLTRDYLAFDFDGIIFSHKIGPLPKIQDGVVYVTRSSSRDISILWTGVSFFLFFDERSVPYQQQRVIRALSVWKIWEEFWQTNSIMLCVTACTVAAQYIMNWYALTKYKHWWMQIDRMNDCNGKQ